MAISLIITVYKDYQALTRVLDSVLRQTFLPNHVILAHDAIDPSIQHALDEYKNKIKLTHIDQEDTGFNKNRILNKAILAAEDDKIVFIDGDCILHPKFIAAHQQYIVPGVFTAGRRLDLDRKSSNQIRNEGVETLSLLQLLLNKTKRIEEGIYLPGAPLQKNKAVRLLGCNMGWHKDDLMAMNGFDMDYMLPGYGEDTDIEFRAHRKGMQSVNLRWKAIQYHLFHERPEREEDVKQSQILFESKKELGYFFCEHGISTLQHQFPHE